MPKQYLNSDSWGLTFFNMWRYSSYFFITLDWQFFSIVPKSLAQRWIQSNATRQFLLYGNFSESSASPNFLLYKCAKVWIRSWNRSTYFLLLEKCLTFLATFFIFSQMSEGLRLYDRVGLLLDRTLRPVSQGNISEFDRPIPLPSLSKRDNDAKQCLCCFGKLHRRRNPNWTNGKDENWNNQGM